MEVNRKGEGVTLRRELIVIETFNSVFYFPSQNYFRMNKKYKKQRRDGGSRGGSELPIHNVARKIVDAVSEHDSVVLVGETGSGKSTQLPQILTDSKRFRVFPRAAICITQPRRVAAVTIAQRVAFER